MSRQPTQNHPASSTRQRASRWEALVSMPLTGLILLAAAALLIVSLVSGPASSAGPVDPADPRAFEPVATDEGPLGEAKVPDPEGPVEAPRPRRVFDMAVAPLDGGLYLLQPVQLVDPTSI